MSSTERSASTIGGGRQYSEEVKKKLDDLGDDEFEFDDNDEHYRASPVCQLMHYRSAAIICGIMEVVLLAFVTLSFFNLQLERGLTNLWMTVGAVIILTLAVFTTILMIYGIFSEQANFLHPQLQFMRVEICILIFCAAVALLSMAMGVDVAHRFLGFFLSVHEMEIHFGPIWPFNVAVLAFFGAAVTNWFHVIIYGAYNYLLDKKYFLERSQNIKLGKKN